MGYLNNNQITVDAILTRRGRELLARGRNEFQITHFALGDDEVDYSLWNTDHPLGTAYYGITIENMPLTEAVVDETQMMKYKLVTLPKRTVRIPIISVGQTAVTLTNGEEITISPRTINFEGGNTTFGYTATLSDSDVASFVGVAPTPAQNNNQDTASSTPRAISEMEASQAVSVTGLSFTLKAKGSTLNQRKATLSITGNETGGRVSVSITVNRITAGTTPGSGITE
jgi:hypothetical protein